MSVTLYANLTYALFSLSNVSFLLFNTFQLGIGVSQASIVSGSQLESSGRRTSLTSCPSEIVRKIRTLVGVLGWPLALGFGQNRVEGRLGAECSQLLPQVINLLLEPSVIVGPGAERIISARPIIWIVSSSISQISHLGFLGLQFVLILRRSVHFDFVNHSVPPLALR